MNLEGTALLLLGCLPALGFAFRGIALVTMRETRPGRVVTPSGIVAMFSVWMLAGVAPIVVSRFRKIFEEFDLDLPQMTELVISVSEWALGNWILWYPLVATLSLGALLVPELVFNRRAR